MLTDMDGEEERVYAACRSETRSDPLFFMNIDIINVSEYVARRFLIDLVYNPHDLLSVSTVDTYTNTYIFRMYDVCQMGSVSNCPSHTEQQLERKVPVCRVEYLLSYGAPHT